MDYQIIEHRSANNRTVDPVIKSSKKNEIKPLYFKCMYVPLFFFFVLCFIVCTYMTTGSKLKDEHGLDGIYILTEMEIF